MALWPFRRKSVRKRSRSGATLSDNEAMPDQSQMEPTLARTTSKKARTEPAKLQRRQRTYSFSPGRHDSIRIDRARRNVEAANRARQGQDDEHNSNLAWERTPTLHPTRRKSSKRRREDHDREAEIKAMSAYMPTRVATEAYTRSGSKQSTKRAKTGDLGRDQKPASQVSLPYPDSVRSVMSADSDFVAYKVSALDALAPRPTLRYTPSTRWTPSKAAASGTTESLKKPLGEREPIQEDPLDSRKRIDDLADDLDAKDLRELMERDNRRRERKRQQDQERMERRLARRAERHRREEAEAKTAGTPPPENLERGVMGRELVGLGIEPASAVVTSSKRRDSDTLPDAPPAEVQNVQPAKPFDSFHRPETSPQDDPASVQEQTLPPPPKAAETREPISALPQGSRLAGLLRSKKSRSKSTLDSDKDRPADEESGRKNSESSNRTTNRISFTSLLKWGSRNQRYSGPSSFSNTSREEMQAATTSQSTAQAEALARLQGEDTANPAHYLASKAGSGAPKRTKSRFREDLPEFPLSPPDSRVQSPEADPPPLPVLTENSPEIDFRHTPPSRHDTPPSIERPKGTQSTEPHLSMSLASIDSEGSWLSGRVGSMRASVQRDSLMRANRRENVPPSESPTNSTREDLAIADDEYLSRLAPDRSSGTMAGRRSGEGRPSSDAEDAIAPTDNVKWGRVGAKPEVVQFHNHDRDTMRSHQGLLNIDSGDEEDTNMLTPSSPV